MNRRFTEEQIISHIKGHESGVGTGGICRRLFDNSVSKGAFYNLAQSTPASRSMRRNE